MNTILLLYIYVITKYSFCFQSASAEPYKINCCQCENEKITTLLDTLKKKDQAVRRKLRLAQSIYADSSQEITLIKSNIQSTDSSNFVLLDSLINSCTFEKIIQINPTVTWLIILHSPKSNGLKYIEGLKIAAQKKVIPYSDVAILEDKILVGSGEDQLYGTQIGNDSKSGLPYLIPIKQPDSLEKRREYAQFNISMEDYLKYFNLTWDLEYYKKTIDSIRVIDKQSRKSFKTNK